MKQNIAILYYHFIKPPEKNTRIKGLYTTPKQFEWQLKQLIKNNFNFLTFEDILKDQYDANKRNIVITFDDGCVSLYENAFPILKKHGLKAVIYPVVESIGKQGVVWDQNENKDPLTLLTEDQILEMSDYGIEFGSHTNNHAHLPLLSEIELERELVDSKLILEKILNKVVYSVAYPFGSYSPEVISKARETGYQFGVTTKNGNNELADNLELFRYGVKGHAIRHYWYFYKLLTSKILKQYRTK